MDSEDLHLFMDENTEQGCCKNLPRAAKKVMGSQNQYCLNGCIKVMREGKEKAKKFFRNARRRFITLVHPEKRGLKMILTDEDVETALG